MPTAHGRASLSPKRPCAGGGSFLPTTIPSANRGGRPKNPIWIWFKTDRPLPSKQSENPNPGESDVPLHRYSNTYMVHYLDVLRIAAPHRKGKSLQFPSKIGLAHRCALLAAPHRVIRYAIVMIGERPAQHFRHSVMISKMLRETAMKTSMQRSA